MSRRMSKHLERKEKTHISSGTGSAGSVEPSSLNLLVGGSNGGGGGESKKRIRKEGSTYKRRKEDDYLESSSRLGDRKRKRDQVDDDLPVIESKKMRTSNEPHEYYSFSSKDTERTSSRSRGDITEVETRGLGERKRRHDSSIVKDESLRKYPKLSSPEPPTTSGIGNSGTSRKHGATHSSRTITSPSNKRGDYQHSHRKERIPGSTGSNESTEDNMLVLNEGENDLTASSKSSHKKLDWISVNSFTRRATAKLEQRPKSALKRYTAGAILSEVGVSPSLAGKEYYAKVSSVVSAHLKEQQEERTTSQPSDLQLLCETTLPESILNNPFGEAEFASAGVSRIKEQLEWIQLIPNCVGPCRRALTASADYNLRRKLRKANQRVSVSDIYHTQ